jgi:histidinol-phosphatase (PHP family)
LSSEFVRMNGLHDQHLHSRFSKDSKADPRANCLHAIDQGLSGLTFTEHYDTHPTERDSCIWDARRYQGCSRFH